MHQYHRKTYSVHTTKWANASWNEKNIYVYTNDTVLFNDEGKLDSRAEQKTECVHCENVLQHGNCLLNTNA